MASLGRPRTAIPTLRNSLPLPHAAPLSPSPVDYPFRQFLPLGKTYTVKSIRSFLSSSMGKEEERCAYSIKVCLPSPLKLPTFLAWLCLGGGVCADEVFPDNGEERKDRCGGVYGSEVE